MHEFRMPSLGADMDAGTLVEWKVKTGDTIGKGDVLAVIETDKGAVEVESADAGVVRELRVPAGDKVPVGTVLAVLGDGEPTPPASAATAPEARSTRPRVSPAARRRARELGVDPSSLGGTGPQGAVVLADVTAATPPSPPPPARGADEAHRGLRRAIAAAMGKSKREIPHYYLESTIDAEPLVTWLTAQNATRSPQRRLLPAAAFLKAVAHALGEVPELNGTWTDGALEIAEAIHIGVAINLRSGGVITPALHDVDSLSLDDVMEGLRELVKRTRAGRLRSSELSEGTITVTNLGERGADTVFGVIYPPQVALVGIGALVERPWVVAGQVVPRHVVRVTLSADHRASDGHRGSVFLEALARRLAEPSNL